jgi:hypothetical protein
MVLPDSLNVSAWFEFVDYRAAKRKRVTELAARKALKLMAAYPSDVQQQMVDRAIASDWQGIHPPKLNGSEMSAAASARRDVDRMEGARIIAALNGLNVDEG